MSKHISLAQQLAQLDQPAPVDFDPEDAAIINAEAEDASEQASNAGREHYLHVGSSALRSRLHESVSDPKYEGVHVTRKQLDEDGEELSDDVPDAQLQPMTSEEEDENSDEEKDSGDLDKESTRERPSEAVVHTLPTPQGTEEKELSLTLKRAREEERKKGKAVARQLFIYDSLLDARIRLQKCVTSMNKLPDATKIPHYLTGSESRDAANKLLFESLCLANDLFELQEKLMTTNESFNLPARKRRKVDSDIEADHDWEEELLESSGYFVELEATLHPHHLATLQKWSNKVLAIAPSALLPSSRTKFSSKNANHAKSAVQLVDEALLEREKLVARTRVWRGTSNRLDTGADPPSSKIADTFGDDGVADIFDDTDFYQALLRDVIDARSSSGGVGARLDGLSADWRAAQQQRRKTRRSTVETRASKGRKLRFDVHEKLQNFMAPAPPPGGVAWHEAQVDELFASLLGKIFTDSGDAPEEGPPAMDLDIGENLKGGFRVFG